MKVIIFCGGTGKRFWPASRAKSPKQFLNIIENKPLVRLKYEYLRLGFKPEDIVVSTGIAYKTEIESILPEIPPENFIYEPAMLDNGPAVAFAVSYVKTVLKDEIVSLQWSDHYIKDPNVFIEALKISEKIALETRKIVLIGEYSRFPSTNRGYIKFGEKLRSIANDGKVVIAEFARFVEKPDQETALAYIQSGDYLWNPGYATAPVDFILEKYKQFAPDIYSVVNTISASNFSHESLLLFTKLEKIGYDFIVSENLSAKDATVLITHMGWSDVGEWDSLKETLEESKEDIISEGLVEDIDSQDSIIYNYDPDRLVATVGLNGYAVVNTKEITAIIKLKEGHKLKKLLSELEKKGHKQFL